MSVNKCSESYESAVTLGDAAFERASLDEAVIFYNTAIQHAQTARQLSVVLANRAVLASLCRKYEASVRDFGRALRSYPQTSGNELATEWDKLRQSAVYRLNKVYSRQRRYPQQQLYSGEHACYPNVSEAIRVEYDANKGRKMVANTDIPAGQVIIREKPFVWAVDADYATTLCQYCCKPLPFDWLPCHSCSRSNVRFCNAQCRDRAWNAFHRYECVLEGDVHTHQLFAENPSLDVMAQRILCNTPLQQLLKHLQIWQSTDHEDDSDEKEKEKKSDVQVLREAHHHDSITASMAAVTMSEDQQQQQQQQQEQQQQQQQQQPRPSTSSRFGVDGRGYGPNIQSLVSLQAYPEADMDWGEDEKLPALLTVTSPSAKQVEKIERMALHALRQLRLRVVLNSCSLQIITPLDDGHLCLPKGSALYMMTSLINHSCLPNLRRHFSSNIIEVRTIRSIKQGEELTFSYGEELTFSYGALYGRLPRSDRQQMMLDAYGFACDCPACTERSYAEVELQMFAEKLKPEATPKKPVDDTGSETRNSEKPTLSPLPSATTLQPSTSGNNMPHHVCAGPTVADSKNLCSTTSTSTNSHPDGTTTSTSVDETVPSDVGSDASKDNPSVSRTSTAPIEKPAEVLSIAQMDSIISHIMYDQSASVPVATEMSQIDTVLSQAQTYFGPKSFLMLDYLLPAVLYYSHAGESHQVRSQQLVEWLVGLIEMFFGAECGREWWRQQMPSIDIEHYHRYTSARQVPVAAKGGGRRSHSRTSSLSSSMDSSN